MKVNFLELKKEWEFFENDFVKSFKKFGQDAYYILGPEVEKFESNFAKYCGYKYAIGVSSGLSALECSLLAHGIKPGDSVITVANSAVATALAISNVGGIPVFCDVDDNYLIDTKKIRALIDKKTRFILPVHLFGRVCNMDKINKIARENNLIIIEDACQAHGADFFHISGGQNNTKAFSFYPTKNLGGLGEGGLVVTNDRYIYDFIKSFRNYGQQGRYNHVMRGSNYRIDTLQCILLNLKLTKLNEFIERRREIATRYIESLTMISDLKINIFDETCAYHLFVIRILNNKREKLMQYLEKYNIQTIIHYPVAIHKQPCYTDEYNNLKLSMTDKLQNEILSIPCHPFLKNEEQEYIIKSICSFFKYND